MNKIKCITFNKEAQKNIPKNIREKMNIDRAKALEERTMNKAEEFFQIWLKNQDTSKNLIEHYKSQRLFFQRFAQDFLNHEVNAISKDEILLDIICQWESLTEKEDIAYAKQFVEDYKNSHRFNKLLKQ